MLSDMMTCIIVTAFILWVYIKSLKENTVDGMTNVRGFLCSLAKYGLVAPTLGILALILFMLFVLSIGLLVSFIFY